MAADAGPWRAWQQHTANALEELDAEEEERNAETARDCRERALVYAVLAVAAAIAHYPDGWGEPERRTE